MQDSVQLDRGEGQIDAEVSGVVPSLARAELPSIACRQDGIMLRSAWLSEKSIANMTVSDYGEPPNAQATPGGDDTVNLLYPALFGASGTFSDPLQASLGCTALAHGTD